MYYIHTRGRTNSSLVYIFPGANFLLKPPRRKTVDLGV